MKILVLNAGSSSLKCHLFDWAGESQKPVWQAHADWSRKQVPARLTISTAAGKVQESEIANPDVSTILRQLTAALPMVPDIAAHRIVHGGSLFHKAVLLTPEVQQQAMGFSPFAPSHNPMQLEIVDEMERMLGPKVPQYGVFDTAFHTTLAPEAYVYAVPSHWLERGIRRYGFHGISHQYVSHQAAKLLGGESTESRIVTAHLGNGCSLAAVVGGVSVATTMGFTPLDGLVMGTRSGSVDPGILIHLVRQYGYSADMLEAELNQDSGLKGISGISGDMRELLAAMQGGSEPARLAFDIYIASIARFVAGLIPAMGGLDALVFTAGIGENSPEVRAAVVKTLAFLGVALDEPVNQNKPMDQVISKAGTKPQVLVVRSEEDWEIARQCFAAQAEP